MGKVDSISKDLLQDNEYFADTVNNALFHGDKVVNPSELVELDTTELAVMKNVNKKAVPVQRYRDVLKKAVIRVDQKAVYVIIGIENQTDVHYAMPVKNLFYDALRYAKQVELASKKHKNEMKEGSLTGKKMEKAEFLSGWKKDDVLLPVITLTVYYGADEWDGAKNIYEMFGKDIDHRLLELVPNYQIHLLEPLKITNWDKFESDIGFLYHTIAVSNQECGIEKLVNSEPEKYRHIDNKIVNAINFYTKSDFQINEEREETDMCIATQTSKEKAGIEAVIKTCIKFKMSLEETTKIVLEDYNVSETYIAEKYNSFLSK